jgi:chromosomal replication initiation ATPase DnaA
MASQLALPLPSGRAIGRKDFIVTPSNAQAIGFIDCWPNWPVAAAAIYGPAGSGKSHIAAVWQSLAAAEIVLASDLCLTRTGFDTALPLVVEDVDQASHREGCARALFHILDRATLKAPVLLTGRQPPSHWPCALPDLRSRFAALASFPLWAPDDELLAQIARKLFADCQLSVPDAVIDHMLCSLERSPAAIRQFVTLLNERSLAKSRPVTLALVRELLAGSSSPVRDGERGR